MLEGRIGYMSKFLRCKNNIGLRGIEDLVTSDFLEFRLKIAQGRSIFSFMMPMVSVPFFFFVTHLLSCFILEALTTSFILKALAISFVPCDCFLAIDGMVVLSLSLFVLFVARILFCLHLVSHAKCIGRDIL